jgi:hypothetical protein
MSRFLKILLILSALAVVISATTYADTKEIETWARYKADSDPGTTPLGTSPWGAALSVNTSTGLLTTPLNCGAGASIWLGVDNTPMETRTKYMTIYLKGSHLDSTNFKLTDKYGVVSGKTSGLVLKIVEWHADAVNIQLEFNPQPDWEVVKFSVVGGGQAATITHFYVDTHCQVPTLTQYGLGILVLLLIATAFVVYRRRHRVIA